MRVPVGTSVRYRVTFTDPSGVLVDPTSVTFKTKSPDGTQTSLTWPASGSIVREAIGIFSILRTLSVAGTWRSKFEGAGALDVASIDVPVRVDPSSV